MCDHPWRELRFDPFRGLRCQSCGEVWTVDNSSLVLWRSFYKCVAQNEGQLAARVKRLEKASRWEFGFIVSAVVTAALSATFVAFVAWQIMLV